jgi:hypothetical protein
MFNFAEITIADVSIAIQSELFVEKLLETIFGWIVGYLTKRSRILRKKAGILQRHTIAERFAVLTEVDMTVPAKPPQTICSNKRTLCRHSCISYTLHLNHRETAFSKLRTTAICNRLDRNDEIVRKQYVTEWAEMIA